MRNLIQQWLRDEIDGDITVNGRDFTLVYDDGRYEVYEDDELIAYNDNAKDFLNVGVFLGLESINA